MVVVLFSGRPLVLAELADQADAILAAWFPGTEGGNAIADLLCGDRAPSGRLNMSFPRHVGQCPVYYSGYRTGRPGKDNDRFSSRYADLPSTPLYPFGYGLTYTCFTYHGAAINSPLITREKPAQISVRVRNEGNRTAVETVQLYIRDMAGSAVRPLRELRGFQQVELPPGREATVSFPVDLDMLRFWTPDLTYQTESGRFEAHIGANSADTICVPFEARV